MRLCSKCGFPLGTRPGLLEKDGVCQACINSEAKKDIDFKARQEWLTRYIAKNKTHTKYDCLVAVSGGKDSHMIVKRLYENHGVKNALLVSVTDEFTHTRPGCTISTILCAVTIATISRSAASPRRSGAKRLRTSRTSYIRSSGSRKRYIAYL